MKHRLNTVSEIKDAISKLSENGKGELFDWLDIHLSTQEMVEQVKRLIQCQTIWWKISNQEDVKHYNEVFQEHLNFFEPVRHILLWDAFFVICYRLFDRRSDSKHIQLLIDQLERTDGRLAKELRRKIENYEVLGKIKIIRNKISAHRDRYRSPQQVAKEVALIAKKQKEVVTFIQDIVSTLAEALTGEKKSLVLQKFSECEDSAHNSVFEIMEVLAKPSREISKED
jgi:hypothetical protein